MLFHVIATDNDTVSSDVEVIVRDSADHEERIVPVYIDVGTYAGGYLIPHEGVYRYRADVHDFWDNRCSAPDSGWRTFATFGHEPPRTGGGLFPIMPWAFIRTRVMVGRGLNSRRSGLCGVR